MQELLLSITILSFVTEGAQLGGQRLQIISVDQGQNFTLPCGAVKLVEGMTVMWIHEDGKDLYTNRNNRIQDDGSIFFVNMKKSDAGVYACKLDTEEKASIEESVEARVRIRVRTPPSAPQNVTVTPFTISASIEWTMGAEGNGGHVLRNFQIAYRLKSETERDWKTCLPALIPPNLKQYSIDHLQPNSTYLVKVWANNKLGSGFPTIVEMVTKNDPQEIELRKHFLDGVDSFDVRIWIIAVGIVVSTLLLLGVATCCLFYKEYNLNLASDSRGGEMDGESIELMPNIILNPGYDFQSCTGMEMGTNRQRPDENANDASLRINNNSHIFPSRV